MPAQFSGLGHHGSLPSFKLFGIPVTIRPSFLAMVVLLALVNRSDPARVVAWVAIVFFSILIHELGHAFAARHFGASVAIELNGLGGLTRWGIGPDQLSPGRRALVAASGSAVGVAFGALLWLIAGQFGPYTEFPAFVINSLIWVNLFWGLLNWVPIRPLDGGHLLQSLLEKTIPHRAEQVARVIFTITSAAALVWALQADLLFIAVLAGWMLFVELAPRGSGQQSEGIPEFTYEEPEGLEVEPTDVEAGDTSAEDPTEPQGH